MSCGSVPNACIKGPPLTGGLSLFKRTDSTFEVMLNGARCGCATDAVSTETMAAVGWHLSWFGFARTCDRVDLLSTPALGLSGWLAHSPDRPRAIAYNAWTDQLIIWLQEDLKTSAWIWHRLASFMRPHKSYLLHPALARPAELAAWRSTQQYRHNIAAKPPRNLAIEGIGLPAKWDDFTSIIRQRVDK
jgi:hypothetical protein